MILNVGDRVKMRKSHPCGNDIWKITYVGADIKMVCEKCSRTVMLDRPTFDKRTESLQFRPSLQVPDHRQERQYRVVRSGKDGAGKL